MRRVPSDIRPKLFSLGYRSIRRPHVKSFDGGRKRMEVSILLVMNTADMEGVSERGK